MSKSQSNLITKIPLVYNYITYNSNGHNERMRKRVEEDSQ